MRPRRPGFVAGLRLTRSVASLCVLLSSLLSAQDVRAIGAVDGAPLYSGVSSVAVDPKRGVIFVADPVQNAVFVFDSLGGLVQRFGRKGEGPGDFDTPVGLTVSPDGTLWVRDFTRVQLFSWERVGAFEGYRVSGQFRGPPMPDWDTREPSFLDLAGSRYFYPHRASSDPRNSYQIYTRAGLADGTIRVPAFPNDGPYTVWVRTSEHGGRMLYGYSAPPFSAKPSWTVTPEGNLLTTDGITYEAIERDPQGRQIRTYRREQPRMRIPTELRADSTIALRRRLDSISVPMRLVEGLPDSVRLHQLPDFFPSIADVLISRSGARVIRRWAIGSDALHAEFDFFSSGGRLLGTGITSASLARRPQPVITCPWLVGVVEDEATGEQVVVRTRLSACW